MFLSDRIRGIAPGNASHYRLKLHSYDGNLRVFPVEEGAFYRVGDSPYGVPSGRFTVCFYDSEQRPLMHSDQPLLINLQNEVHRSSNAQLSLNLPNAVPSGGPVGGAGEGSGQAAPPAAAPPPAPVAPAVKPSEALADDDSDLEFRKHLHALDLEERQQEFIRNSTYVKEVGEAFLLNRLMRREMMEMQRNMVLHSQQAFRDIEQVKSTIHSLLGLQEAVLTHAEKHKNTPPVPPPDYVGLGQSALAMFKEVAVAIVQKWQPERPALPPSHAPQLPASSATSPEAPPAAGAGSAAGVLERLVKKLQTTTDLDVAQAMSSPEGWKKLLDDCLRADTATAAAAEPAASSDLGLEG